MLQATEFLRLMRFITKSHEACIQSICREHQLSMMEATIITFLRNNPNVDTAADIAELRMPRDRFPRQWSHWSKKGW